MNWALISQIGSIIVAVVASVVTFLNNRSNNKIVKELELTKQKFAQENEKLKRNQAMQDFKNNLISNFLGDLASCLNQFDDINNLRQAQKSAGQVLPICNSEEKKLVNDTLSKIAKAGEYGADRNDFKTANESVLATLKAFNYDLKKQQ